MKTLRTAVLLVALIVLVGCSEDGASPTPAPTESATAILATSVTGTPAATPTNTATPEPTSTVSPGTPTGEATAGTVAPVSTVAPSTPEPSPTPGPGSTETATPSSTAVASVPEIRATHLRIPKLGIDAEVQGSQIVPYTGTAPEGCPAPTATTTLTVPSQGIATPEETWDGIERKSWIYGHSRWQGVPGLFFSLPGLSVGDELFVDGFDRVTGDPVSNRRFVVDGLYLSDTDSGGTLVNAQSPDEIPSRPQVILQTSVRERGVGKAWILDRDTLLAKAETRVAGDLDDPCKYLLFFVFATAA